MKNRSDERGQKSATPRPPFVSASRIGCEAVAVIGFHRQENCLPDGCAVFHRQPFQQLFPGSAEGMQAMDEQGPQSRVFRRLQERPEHFRVSQPQQGHRSARFPLGQSVHLAFETGRGRCGQLPPGRFRHLLRIPRQNVLHFLKTVLR